MGKRILSFILLFISTLSLALPVQETQYLRYPGLLTNNGFENGKARWTNSGSGTFSLDTSTNLGFGGQSAAWDAAANNDTLTSEQVTLPRGLYGQACRAEFMQKGGDTAITAKVIDGSLATVASQALAAKTNFTTIEIDFTCPTSGTVAFQLLASGNAAAVYIDQVYIGLKGASGGSGEGLPNSITNGNAETTAVPTNWSTYDDGASASVVDGTGGSPTAISSIARTTTTAELITGSGSWKLSKSAANGQGEGWAYDFSVPAKSPMMNALNSLDFDFYVTSNYASGDMRAYLYDKDATTIITPAFITCGGGSAPGISQSLTACHAKLTWVATTSDDYRLVFHIATTNASAWDFFFDNLYVGQYFSAVGAAIGPAQTFSPTYSAGLGTVTTLHSFYRRVGDMLEAHVRITTGTVAASTASIALPSGLTIDSSKILNSTVVGSWIRNNASATTRKGGKMVADTTTIYFTSDDYTNSTSPFSTLNGSSAFASTEVVSYQLTVPIAEWAGAPVSFGENVVEYACTTGTWDADSSTMSYTPFGCVMGGALTATRTKTVTFQTAIQATDTINVQSSTDGIIWQDIDGGPGATGTGNITRSRDSANAILSGVVWRKNSATAVDVLFARYAQAANDDSPTTDWANNNYWRVVKYRGAVPVGFGLAMQNSPGLYNVGQAYGTNTNDSACEPCVGYYTSQSRLRSAATALTTATTANVLATPLTLTAGDWDLYGVVGFTLGATTSATVFQAGISVTSATLPAADTMGVPNSSGEVRAQYALAASVINNDVVFLPVKSRVSISSTTTFYLVTQSTFTISTNSAYGSLTARRAR